MWSFESQRKRRRTGRKLLESRQQFRIQLTKLDYFLEQLQKLETCFCLDFQLQNQALIWWRWKWLRRMRFLVRTRESWCARMFWVAIRREGYPFWKKGNQLLRLSEIVWFLRSFFCCFCLFWFFDFLFICVVVVVVVQNPRRLVLKGKKFETNHLECSVRDVMSGAVIGTATVPSGFSGSIQNIPYNKSFIVEMSLFTTDLTVTQPHYSEKSAKKLKKENWNLQTKNNKSKQQKNNKKAALVSRYSGMEQSTFLEFGKPDNFINFPQFCHVSGSNPELILHFIPLLGKFLLKCGHLEAVSNFLEFWLGVMTFLVLETRDSKCSNDQFLGVESWGHFFGWRFVMMCFFVSHFFGMLHFFKLFFVVVCVVSKLWHWWIDSFIWFWLLSLLHFQSDFSKKWTKSKVHNCSSWFFSLWFTHCSKQPNKQTAKIASKTTQKKEKKKQTNKKQKTKQQAGEILITTNTKTTPKPINILEQSTTRRPSRVIHIRVAEETSKRDKKSRIVCFCNNIAFWFGESQFVVVLGTCLVVLLMTLFHFVATNRSLLSFFVCLFDLVDFVGFVWFGWFCWFCLFCFVLFCFVWFDWFDLIGLIWFDLIWLVWFDLIWFDWFDWFDLCWDTKRKREREQTGGRCGDGVALKCVSTNVAFSLHCH